MLFDTGQQVRTERFLNYSTMNRMLTRFIPFPGGIDVSVLYASEDYFAYADRAGTVESYRPDTHYVFFVNEDVHTGYLPEGLPEATLEIDDRQYVPVASEGPELVEHHRMTVIRFSKIGADGKLVAEPDTGQLILKLRHPWDRFALENGVPKIVESTYIWDLPLDIPPELKSGNTFTSAMVFSLAAGLLSSVLTPCLLQLVIIFFAALGGVSAKEAIYAGGITPEVRLRVLWAAVCFVAGYVALFVTSGALIGYVGKEAQLFFAAYTRPVAVAAGVVVILFGILTGIRSRVPLICRLPGAELMQRLKGKGTTGTVIISIAFSLGCMSCFGGAIIGTLFIYVGALGSAWVGALIMGIFAAGVAVPFLLAAMFFSRMKQLFDFVGENARSVGAISSAVIIAFGVLLITDDFHTVSDLVYPYLGLD